MSLEKVRQYFRDLGLEERIRVFHQSSASVREAALALGCEEKEIAKTLSFLLGERVILILAAGDAKIDNKKFKDCFGQRASMIAFESVEFYTGHAPGGVCPFANPPHTEVYLDCSLKRFQKIFPAAGNAYSAVELSPEELERCSSSRAWVDVCKGWEI
ncbi:MAG: YbaK/EbsC family protein [Johnsonella sp.]|nr:YbaK/EbsC family protein [Johnsonella sp.]